MDDPYTHLYNRHPLVPTRHDIRLLYITPGDRDEPIHCTLQVKSLDESPEFEALSYVWGDEFATLPVAVEDVTLDVTLNLFSALRALRPRPGTSRRPLWVDAICINQRSVEEKNHQVPMMARIYRECKDVIAWQGEPEPPVVLFLNLVLTMAREPRLAQQLFKYSVRSGFPRMKVDDVLEASWRKESVDSERDDDSESDDDNFLSTFTPLITSRAKSLGFLEEVQAVDGLTAFKEFFIQTRLLQAYLTADDGGQKVVQNIYWRRIWTFQEYELPAAVPLCRHGEISIRWEEVEISIALKIQFFLTKSIARLDRKLPLVVEALPTPEMKDLANGIVKNMGVRVEDAMTSTLRAVDKRTGLEMLVTRRSQRSQIIFVLFWFTHDCDYSDPRDRLYALHGLLPTLATAHPPDYSRDPSIVIVEALAFDVNRRSEMFYLGLSFMPLQPRRLASDRPQQYPSWMPAVGAGSKRPLLRRLPFTKDLPHGRGKVSKLFERRVEDEEGRVIKPSVVPDQHILKSPVVKLRGTTRKLVTFAETLEQIQSQLASLVDSLLRIQLFTSLPDLAPRLVRCMSSYDSAQTGATKDFLVSEIDRIMSNRQNSETALAADLGLFLDQKFKVRYVLHEEVRDKLQRKTVFIIDERMLGFGMDIQDGDTICIIPTLDFPFAICKEREDPEHGTIWNMVGGAYVDGLMENEGVDRVMVDELLNTPAEMLTFQ